MRAGNKGRDRTTARKSIAAAGCVVDGNLVTAEQNFDLQLCLGIAEALDIDMTD